MKLKVTISVTCAILAVLHVTFPTVRIDYITLILLVLGVLPWFSPLIKSLELPGGLKIELQDVKAATDKVTAGAKEREGVEVTAPPPVVVAHEESSIERLREIGGSNPNLALVGLRIEIERRLTAVAMKEKIPTKGRSAGWLLRELQERKKLSPEIASGLNELVALGNQAAHGAHVTRDAAEWALDKAPAVLGILEAPQHAFLHLWADFERSILAAGGETLDVAFDRLVQKGLLSPSERSELESLGGLYWDVRVGFGDWIEESAVKIGRLKELHELLKRRIERGGCDEAR
jgi:hypothetical protein